MGDMLIPACGDDQGLRGRGLICVNHGIILSYCDLQSIRTMKVLADEAASHVNPKSPPLNAIAIMAVVPRLRRRVAFLKGCCTGQAWRSVVCVMVSSEVISQKLGIKNRSEQV